MFLFPVIKTIEASKTCPKKGSCRVADLRHVIRKDPKKVNRFDELLFLNAELTALKQGVKGLQNF